MRLRKDLLYKKNKEYFNYYQFQYKDGVIS